MPFAMARCLSALILLLSPTYALVFKHSSVKSADGEVVGGSSGGQVKSGSGTNILMAMYERWTYQYQKDAKEAQDAAAKYAQLTAQEAANMDAASMHAEVAKRLKDMGVDTWAYAAWEVQNMLNNPAPVKAAAAAAAAAAPYNAAYAAYDKTKASYNGASIGYALRAKQDAGLAHQLMTYSNQFRLQGNNGEADTYAVQSKGLMTQAEKFKGLADQYDVMAQKIYGVLPAIQSWAGKAGAYAAYEENPLGALPAKEIFPFTVVPPAPAA